MKTKSNQVRIETLGLSESKESSMVERAIRRVNPATKSSSSLSVSLEAFNDSLGELKSENPPKEPNSNGKEGKEFWVVVLVLVAEVLLLLLSSSSERN